MGAKRSPLWIAGISMAVAIGLAMLGLIFANPETCPIDYTQDQVDATGCSVGANIGLGLVFLLALTIAISGLIVALVEVRQRKPATAPTQPLSAHQPPRP